MKVQVSKSKNACSYYITKGFRDPKTGRPTTKVVERLGNESAIRAKIGPDADIMEWCRARAGELEELVAVGVQIDILVSDVTMPEGQPSGIDMVQRLFPQGCATQVIYMSGYLEQATEVYRTSHVYFLLKPLDPEKLRDALRRAYEALPGARPAMLRIKTGHQERLLNASAISYLESALHKVRVHCGAQTYETYARLDDLQDRLPQTFSRCHRSFLVNLAYVSRLERDELLLHDGTQIPVSRRRARQVQRDLLRHLATQGEG